MNIFKSLGIYEIYKCQIQYTLNGTINYSTVLMPPYRSDYMPILIVMGTYSHILSHTWTFLLKSSGAGYQSALENVVLSHEHGVHIKQHQENNCCALLEARLP